MARREDDLLRLRALSPHTSPDGNDGLHFELASLVVNYFSRGGGGSSGVRLPPVIYNAGSGKISGGGRNGGVAGSDVVKGCYENGIFVVALSVANS